MVRNGFVQRSVHFLCPQVVMFVQSCARSPASLDQDEETAEAMARVPIQSFHSTKDQRIWDKWLSL